MSNCASKYLHENTKVSPNCLSVYTSDPSGAFEPQNRGRKSHDTVTVRRSLSFITFKEQFGHGWFSILCVNSAEYSYWKYYKKIRKKETVSKLLKELLKSPLKVVEKSGGKKNMTL